MRLYKNLPDIAKKSFYIDIISSEIQNTNNIEGVKSSREEIAYTTKEVVKNNLNNELKFLSIVKAYTTIKNMSDDPIIFDVDNIKRLENIRKTYDNITSDGVNDKDLPDGELFRKGSVYIQGKNETVHNRVSNKIDSEPIIKEYLLDLLDFMNIE